MYPNIRAWFSPDKVVEVSSPKKAHLEFTLGKERMLMFASPRDILRIFHPDKVWSREFEIVLEDGRKLYVMHDSKKGLCYIDVDLNCPFIKDTDFNSAVILWTTSKFFLQDDGPGTRQIKTDRALDMYRLPGSDKTIIITNGCWMQVESTSSDELVTAINLAIAGGDHFLGGVERIVPDKKGKARPKKSR